MPEEPKVEGAVVAEGGAAPAAVEPKVAEGAAPAAAEVKPAAAEAPVAPVVEKPVEGAKEPAKAPEAAPSLLETAKAEGDKPAEGAKPAEAKPGDGKEPAKVGAAVPAIEFKPYTLPEGFKPDEPRIKSFNEILTKPDLSPQDRGQALIDLHTQHLTDYANHIAQEQHRIFDETRATWRGEIKSDPEIGGAGYDTTIKAGARMRDLFVREKDRPAFDRFLRTTGAGDHPEFWRFLSNLAKRFDEPGPRPAGYKPPPDLGRKPGSGGRRETLYDHPNSEAKRGT